MLETGRELGGGRVGLTSSPPRSARVLRFNGFEVGGGIDVDDERALLAEADISTSLPGEGLRLGCGSCEGNYITHGQFSVLRLPQDLSVPDFHYCPPCSKPDAN